MNRSRRLFVAEGLTGTSTGDITDAAGVNLASVNYRFASKDGPISAVFDRRQDGPDGECFKGRMSHMVKEGGFDHLEENAFPEPTVM